MCSRPGDSTENVVVMAANGRDKKIVHRVAAFRGAWAPGGRRVAWDLFDGEVWVGSLRSARGRFLSEGDYSAWSPNGKSIAVVTGDRFYGTCENAIAIVDVETGQLRRTLGVGECGLLETVDWSPNGRRLVYERYDGQSPTSTRVERTEQV